MSQSTEAAPNADLTQIVIGAAMSVLNTLKPGLDEKLYERALVIELAKHNIHCDSQKQHKVFYDRLVLVLAGKPKLVALIAAMRKLITIHAHQERNQLE